MANLKPKFFGKKDKGKFILGPNDAEQFKGYLQQFEEGQELEMTIARKYKRRTSGAPDEETNFNGYYWGVIVRMIADEIGELGEDGYQRVHAWIQMNVGNFKGMPDGKVVPSGTKYKSGGEFADMCSRARIWASTPGSICEKGMYIPEPNEASYDEIG